MSESPSAETAPRNPGLRVGFVPGVTTTKWQRLWEERFAAPLTVHEVADADQRAVLESGELDMCFVRTPIDRTGLHAIPLYEEVMVAWVAKEHPIAAYDEISESDLAEETRLTQVDEVAISRVLAGAVLVVPMSIARSASRRDLVHRPITDAAPSPVALAWRVDDDHPLIDEFIGIVRGRTPNSSRSARERAEKPPRVTPIRRRVTPARRGGARRRGRS